MNHEQYFGNSFRRDVNSEDSDTQQSMNDSGTSTDDTNITVKSAVLTRKEKIKKFFDSLIIGYIKFNYKFSISIGVLCLISTIFLRNEYIEVEYITHGIRKLYLGNVTGILSLTIGLYVLLSIAIKAVLSYIQTKRVRFSLYLYCTINSSEHISLAIITLTFMALSYTYDLNFKVIHEIGIEMNLNDTILVIIVSNFLLFFITFFTKMVSTTYNKETYVERMLNVFRIHYFFDLMKIVRRRLLRGNNIEDSDLWEYAFPWADRSAKVNLYQTEKYANLKEIYFARNSDKITVPGYRNWIFETFKKIPENVIYTEHEIEVSKTGPRAKSNKVGNLLKKISHLIVTVDDLSRFFDSKERFEKFMKCYEFKRKTKISRVMLEHMLERNYYEIKYVQQSLKQILSALTRVQNFLYVIVLVLMVAYVFSRNPKNTSTATSLISGFFGTGIIFQSSVTSAIDSIIFLFCIHPFDIGDRVFITIDDINENFVVTEMNVFSTVFLRFDGTIAYIPNSVLLSKTITNVRRSGMMAESHKIQISTDTSKEDLSKLEKQISTYLSNTHHLFTGFCMLNVENIENCNKMHLKIFVQHKHNWHDFTGYLQAKKDLLLHLNKIMVNLGISYELPEQRVILRNCDKKKEEDQMVTDEIQSSNLLKDHENI
ncbi:hypothetical protein COBT_002516 [Conglomerata obtusa]